MTNYDEKFPDFWRSGLAMVLLVISMVAAAGPEDVINERWPVTVSKIDLSNHDCGEKTCLNTADEFEIQVQNLSSNGHGKGQLIIWRGVWSVNFDALVRVHETNQQTDYVDVFFIDDKVQSSSSTTSLPLKRMRITPVDRANKEACRQRFDELDRDQFKTGDFEAACPSDGVITVHWSICSLDPTFNCGWFDPALNLDIDEFPESITGVPDDGQGAGGPVIP